MPTLKELNALARKRSKALREAESGLLERAGGLENKLLAFVRNEFLPSLDIADNKITNSISNLRKVNDSSSLKKYMRKVVNVAMYEYYQSEFNNVTNLTNGYYNTFEPKASQQKKILERGAVIVDGYLDSVFDNNQIVRSIQGTVRNAVSTNQALSVALQLLQEQIQGKEDKFGLVKYYHYQNGYDEFQAYSRTLDEDYSKALELNYAIYAGGEMKTTRQFCTERNGNVYNRETILSWDDEEWQGKKPNNNILIDLGGYNCRHDLDWISFNLAKRLDPSIEKSTFDK
jgi:hypothetical protein